MNKLGIIAILTATIATSTSIGLAQTQALDAYGTALFSGRPFFTDESLYSSYHLGSSPLGLFDLGSPSFGIGGGYRYSGLGDGSGHYLSGQSIVMGEPGRFYFKGFYGPDLLSYKNPLYYSAGNPTSLTLQRFGLAVAAQAGTGTFRSSLIAEAYYGKQKWEQGDSTRALMGVERLRLDFGSHPHPLFRVGLFFGVTGRVDTLYLPNVSSNDGRDFSAQVNLPEFGVNLDFGGEDVPVQSSVAFSYAFSRFIYTTKGASGAPPTDVSGNASPILNDSFDLFWVTRGLIPVNGGDYVFTPALLLGFTGNAGSMYEPHPDNDPLQLVGVLSDVRRGSDYNLGGFWLGVGTGFTALKYAEAHAEYAFSTMSLETGSYYTGSTVKKARTLHHASFGASTPLHEYLALPLNITPRIAYFVSGAAGISGIPHLGLEPLNAVSARRSKRPLYAPQNFLNGFERVSGFTIGVDALALEEQLSASFWSTFLASSDKSVDGGLEIGVRVGFWVK